MTTSTRRWLAGLCLLAGLACTGTAQAEPDCPPVAGAPSPDALAAAARTASDRGPLWRIERDGRSSWLYGTLHVGRLAWAFPGPNVSAALHRLALAWERADLAALASYEDWCECARDEAERAFSKRLNDDRNPGLADAIARLHNGGQSVFAAVGALHMTGPQALPALLRARGFKLQALRWARP